MTFHPDQIEQITDRRERQKATIQQFNQAMEAHDYDTAAAISD